MPRISKIRLTGCKYEGFKKEHEDSFFDLTKDGVADHALFTLVNGGGKGVMLQLIFQLLLPNTRWGNNDGNKVISMFFDQRNNLYPYTFHVVLEWVLDTIPEKRLITGIAMKAMMKNTSEDEEDKTDLFYYLYSHEHDNNGYFSVENLPLYDRKAREAVDIEVFDNFLRDNKRDFIKYAASSARRSDGEYYRYLESRGIYRAEWMNLKTMNKSEGGVGDYFRGASDNKSIFDKIIIPAISENLRNYSVDDGDNLIQMFKSNLLITKNLPILIKQEGDFKELLIEIDPLIKNADSGSRFLDIKERLIDEGNDIYFILKDEESRVLEQIEKWTEEERKALEEKKELEFKKDNINYNMEKRNLESKEREAEKLEKLFNEKNIILEEKREDLLKYEINEVLSDKEKTEVNIQIKLVERERLIESLDISDIESRIQELDDEIYDEFESMKKVWNNKENQYYGYLNYIKGIKEENINKIRNYEANKSKLENEINKFQLREEELERKKNKLLEFYDALEILFPERILENLINSKEKTKELINSLIEQKNIFHEDIQRINNELNKNTYGLESLEDKIRRLNENIEEKERQELNLARGVSRILLENYDGSLLNHDWFRSKLERVESLEESKIKIGEEIQRKIWEKNIEKSLNVEDYFIPNKDIILIKNEIKSLNIHVETGVEYLKGIDEKEGTDILEKHPAFLYSLVIGDLRDWELINRNMNKDIFLSNMVPIYIRSEMKEKDRAFNLVLGKNYELIDNENFMKWKNNLEKEFELLTQKGNRVREDLKEINAIKKELILTLEMETSFTLNQKLKKLEEDLLEIRDRVRVLEKERLNYENHIYILEKDLAENHRELDRKNLSIGEIKNYIEMVEIVEGERLNIERVKIKLEDIRINIENLLDDNQGIEEREDSIRDSFILWRGQIRDIIRGINTIYKELNYTPMIQEEYRNHNIPDFPISAEALQILMRERRVLEEDIKGRNNEIAKIDIELEHFYKELRRHVKDLNKIDRNWNRHLRLEISLSEITLKIEEIKRVIKGEEKERAKIKTALDSIKGSIGEIKKNLESKGVQVQKDHKRTPIIIDMEDLLKELNIVERDLVSNREYLAFARKEIEKFKKISYKLQINLNRMKDNHQLDPFKGKMNNILKGKIKTNPDLVVDDWSNRIGNNEREVERTIREGERYKGIFLKKAESRLEEDNLKEKIISAIKESNTSNFKSNLTSFESMKRHFQNSILSLAKDKERAENAMKQWTDRASIYVIRMLDALKDMVNSMNYINEQGYVFPLVKLRGIERLPKSQSEVIYLLEEYFIQTISEILEENIDIDKIEDRTLNNLMGDRAIFSKALQGRYPTLLVYKMSEKNEFKYARARDEYYTTWEAINKGEGDMPEGSGGQTLSVNTFVLMMIMSFKKKHIGNENPSTVLILDNPFGKASAKHVLDPIFEIANKLNFQLITFAAPEIIKMEISERFPIFWELKIEEGKIVHGGRIIKENS